MTPEDVISSLDGLADLVMLQLEEPEPPNAERKKLVRDALLRALASDDALASLPTFVCLVTHATRVDCERALVEESIIRYELKRERPGWQLGQALLDIRSAARPAE